MQRIQTHLIFGALTRPAMTGGVTFEFHGLNLVVSVCAFIAMNNPLYALVFFPLHAAGYLVCQYDPALFTLIYKNITCLPRRPNYVAWGVSSYAP